MNVVGVLQQAYIRAWETQCEVKWQTMLFTTKYKF